MTKKHFSLKIIIFLQPYFLVVMVLSLVLFQLELVSILFQVDSLSSVIQSFFVLLFAQPELFVLFFVGGFAACCSIWYLYRPTIVAYLYLKDYLYSIPRLSFIFGIRPFHITNQFDSQCSWITRLASKISKKLAIKAPKVVVDPSLAVNARVLPGFFHAPVVVLTQGLLDKLTPDEIEAVLAHELAHIAMHDTYSMSVADLIIFLSVWLPVYLSHIVIDYLFLYKWRNKNIGFIVSLLVVLLAYGFFALLVLNTLNRRYELRADKIAMQLVNIQSFLNALHRIHSSQRHIPGVLDDCMASMPTVLQQFVLRLFLSHPPIPARIQALQ